MKYLLDTHTVLWWFDDPKKLSKEAREIIEEKANVVMISSVVTWEIVIKQSLNKLRISDELFSLIQKYFTELPITIAHTLRLKNLPQHHNDPFDRLLIAQAKEEDAVIITKDKAIEKYSVKTMRA